MQPANTEFGASRYGWWWRVPGCRLFYSWSSACRWSGSLWDWGSAYGSRAGPVARVCRGGGFRWGCPWFLC